jgi:hypothetical protein
MAEPGLPIVMWWVVAGWGCTIAMSRRANVMIETIGEEKGAEPKDPCELSASLSGIAGSDLSPLRGTNGSQATGWWLSWPSAGDGQLSWGGMALG